jgi:cystathionine gamma-lyase
VAASYGFRTRAIHAGQKPADHRGAVTVPIYQTSTFAFQGANQPGEFDYSRSGNPTRQALERCLAQLENGVAGFAFGTGMAAETTALMLFSAGDRLIVHSDLYGGTWRLFEDVFRNKGIDAGYIDLRDTDLVDLRAIAELAHRHGALTICDNTFLSPYFQRPLDLGIDLVLHSTTKYINGHSDVVSGAIVAREAGLAARIGALQNATGSCAAPQDCFLVLRGLKTLAIRMEEHNRNALAIARWLAQHPKVGEVLHPGLETHPQHELARRQMSGYGGTFSFRLTADRAGIFRLLEGVRLFILAESLGGVESLIDHPATMTHASIPADLRGRMGISENLIRLSVGIEDIDDLIADLDQALQLV